MDFTQFEMNEQESDAESTFMPAAMNMPFNQPYTHYAASVARQTH